MHLLDFIPFNLKIFNDFSITEITNIKLRLRYIQTCFLIIFLIISAINPISIHLMETSLRSMENENLTSFDHENVLIDGSKEINENLKSNTLNNIYNSIIDTDSYKENLYSNRSSVETHQIPAQRADRSILQDLHLDAFLSVWDTVLRNQSTSNFNQIKLPLVVNGLYNFIVDWEIIVLI
jgi:hypothetical protein